MNRRFAWLAFGCVLLTSCTVRPPNDPNTTPTRGNRTESGALGETQAGTGANLSRILANGALFTGTPDAPLTLLVVTEYHCGYCRQFQEEILPRLRTEFIDRGLLSIATLILPLKKYPGSADTAAALFCAGMQDAGQGMHDLLFSDPSAIDAHAVALKLDRTAFDACRTSPQAVDLLKMQQSWLSLLDVTLVPTFFLDGEKFVGLPSWADLRGRIDRALEERP